MLSQHLRSELRKRWSTLLRFACSWCHHPPHLKHCIHLLLSSSSLQLSGQMLQTPLHQTFCVWPLIASNDSLGIRFTAEGGVRVVCWDNSWSKSFDELLLPNSFFIFLRSKTMSDELSSVVISLQKTFRLFAKGRSSESDEIICPFLNFDSDRFGYYS